MPSPLFLSRPPPGFSPLAVLRGVQLTFLGGYRALKNPELSKYGYYRKALIAIGYSIVIQFIIWIPLFSLKLFLKLLAYFMGFQSHKIRNILEALRFLQNHVFNLGPVLISVFRYFRPDIDEIFMLSLKYIDQVYAKKHPGTKRDFYQQLVKYEQMNWQDFKPEDSKYDHKTSACQVERTRKSLRQFIRSYMIRTAMSLAAYSLSGVPILGRLVLPIMTFRSLNPVIGGTAAGFLATMGLVISRKYMVIFLSSFWGGRSLARELLTPYFDRVPFSASERELWFSNREGILFGFGCGFYLLLRIPFLGILIYGFSEASSAYLLTKISDPPPPPAQIFSWTEHQKLWTVQEDDLAARMVNDGF